MRDTIRRATWALALPTLLAATATTGCVEDVTWVDEVQVILEAPADHLRVVAIEVQEGNLDGNESTTVDDTVGVVLAEVSGTGSHELHLTTTTPSQRASVLLMAWADDADEGAVGEPDCLEMGVRLHLPTYGDETYVLPSDEYPLSFCGALIDR